MVSTGVSKEKRLQGAEIAQAILEVCGSVTIGKHVWCATLIKEPTKNEGREINAVGVRIERQQLAIPKKGIGKAVRNVTNALEPIIMVAPLYECCKPRCVTVDLLVGGRRFSNPKDSILMIPLRNDLEVLLKMIKGALPQDVKCSF